jgi:hypothetical protein
MCDFGHSKDGPLDGKRSVCASKYSRILRYIKVYVEAVDDNSFTQLRTPDSSSVSILREEAKRGPAPNVRLIVRLGEPLKSRAKASGYRRRDQPLYRPGCIGRQDSNGHAAVWSRLPKNGRARSFIQWCWRRQLCRTSWGLELQGKIMSHVITL